MLADRGRSQTELATALGVTPPAVSQKLSGTRRITDTEVVTIAQFLDVDPGDLFRPIAVSAGSSPSPEAVSA